MPNRGGDLADALVNFTNLVIPQALQVTGLSGHAPANGPTITGVLTPFLCLVILNCLSFMLMKLVGKLLLRLIELSTSLLNLLLATLFEHIPERFKFSTQRKKMGRLFFKKAERKTFAGNRSRTRINTSSDSWERVTSNEKSHTVVHEDYSEVIEALQTLGLKASATQKEIRGAYIALMKQYHPDLYTNASLEQQRKIRAAALEIRTAYDTIVKQFNQVQ